MRTSLNINNGESSLLGGNENPLPSRQSAKSAGKTGSSYKQAWPSKSTTRYRPGKRRSVRQRYNYTESWLKKYIETIISQCIVSGIVLSAILILRIIQVPETLALREQIYTTIGTNMDMAYEARNLGAMLLAVIRTEEAPTAQHEESLATPEAVPVFDAVGDNQNFRIDEDILQQIHSREIERLLEFREYRSLP